MRRLQCGGLVLLAALVCGAPAQEKGAVIPAAHVAPAARKRDLTQWPVAQQQFHYSAQLATEWLRRHNKPDGRFYYGFLPALFVPMEGDNYIHQAAATGALARAARYLGDDASTAIARQALLTLLLETTADPKDPQQRYTAHPPPLVNRLAGNGTLLRAIHELSAPGKDLLEQSDQLAGYIIRQQRSDGALPPPNGETPPNGTREATVLAESACQAAGLALDGVIRSHQHRPGAAKVELLRKALPYYLLQWQKHPNMPLAVSHTPAYAEAYRITKVPAFAEAVFALNDWLCSLQYTTNDAWVGGFPAWENGQALRIAPDIRSAACAESLAEACRVARAANDLARYQRYRGALEQCLQFLLTLQYAPARTRHFAADCRPFVLGAFFASRQDGNLRLDYTQMSLAALAVYLEQVAE